MPTLKQKLAFQKITENHLPLGKAMREVGYAKNTAVKPQNLTESKGFKELCEEAGLTDEFLLGALQEDIEKKPQNRKAELELAFKVKGRLTETPQGNKTLIINIAGETNQRYEIGDGKAM